MKYHTKEWYAKCQKANTPPFDTKLELETKETINQYLIEYSKNFPVEPDFMNLINKLHDSEVAFIENHGNDLIIKVECIEYGPIYSAEIVLKNANIIEHEHGNDLGWEHCELFPKEKGYEIHCLFFQYGTSNLFLLTAECDNIEIQNKKYYEWATQ